MKAKRLLSLCVCVCMLLCMIPALSTAKASDGVIFTVVNNVVSRPLYKNTMPIVENGEVYVPYTVFSTLETIDHYYDSALGQLIYYRNEDRLVFDLAFSRTFDNNGMFFNVNAQYRNSTIYIPAGVVCAKFGLYYTFTDYSTIAPMLRINEGEPIGTDIQYTAQLYPMFQNLYNTYIDSPEITIPIEETEPRHIAYLTFSGVPQNTDAFFNALGDTKVTLFLTPGEIAENGSFVSMAFSQGHCVGIMLDPTLPLKPQIDEAYTLFELRFCTKPRIAQVFGGSVALPQEERNTIISSALRLWDTTLYAEGDISSPSFFEKLSGAGSGTVISVSANAPASEISSMITGIKSNGYSVLKTEDWYAPINELSDIR